MPEKRTTPKATETFVVPTTDDELKEVKVKLPVSQVMKLHYARMKKRKNFSEIVSTALTRYLDDYLQP